MNGAHLSAAVAALLAVASPVMAQPIHGQAQQREEWIACMGARTIAKARAEERGVKIAWNPACECKLVRVGPRTLHQCTVDFEVNEVLAKRATMLSAQTKQ